MIKRFVVLLFSFLIFLSCYCESTPIQFEVKGVSFKMIQVDGGSFWLGRQSTNPKLTNYRAEADKREVSHEVSVESYYIGETEVTQELYEAVCDTNPSQQFRGPKYPVDGVSWADGYTFAEKLNELLKNKLPKDMRFAMPTEIQWEWAARGGKKGKNTIYSGSNNFDEVGWNSGNSKGDNWTHEVAFKKPNELGIYDMSGNLEEYCSDYYFADTDSIKRRDYFGVRGGGWKQSNPLSRTIDMRTGTDYVYREVSWRTIRLALVKDEPRMAELLANFKFIRSKYGATVEEVKKQMKGCELVTEDSIKCTLSYNDKKVRGVTYVFDFKDYYSSIRKLKRVDILLPEWCSLKDARRVLGNWGFVPLGYHFANYEKQIEARISIDYDRPQQIMIRIF